MKPDTNTHIMPGKLHAIYLLKSSVEYVPDAVGSLWFGRDRKGILWDAQDILNAGLLVLSTGFIRDST